MITDADQPITEKKLIRQSEFGTMIALKRKTVHTGLYLVRKGKCPDGATLSFFTGVLFSPEYK